MFTPPFSLESATPDASSLSLQQQYGRMTSQEEAQLRQGMQSLGRPMTRAEQRKMTGRGSGLGEAVAKEPLLKLIFAGSLGSMTGGLIMKSFYGEQTTAGWLFLLTLIGAYAILAKHPTGLKLFID